MSWRHVMPFRSRVTSCINRTRGKLLEGESDWLILPSLPITCEIFNTVRLLTGAALDAHYRPVTSLGVLTFTMTSSAAAVWSSFLFFFLVFLFCSLQLSVPVFLVKKQRGADWFPACSDQLNILELSCIKDGWVKVNTWILSQTRCEKVLKWKARW